MNMDWHCHSTCQWQLQFLGHFVNFTAGPFTSLVKFILAVAVANGLASMTSLPLKTLNQYILNVTWWWVSSHSYKALWHLRSLCYSFFSLSFFPVLVLSPFYFHDLSLYLLGRCSTTWTSRQPFLCWLFLRQLHFILVCDPPIYASPSSWDDRYEPPRSPIDWDGAHTAFCLGWPHTVILLIFNSRVARITDVSHCTQPDSLWLSKTPLCI
jgi:hypothetical protein